MIRKKLIDHSPGLLSIMVVFRLSLGIQSPIQGIRVGSLEKNVIPAECDSPQDDQEDQDAEPPLAIEGDSLLLFLLFAQKGPRNVLVFLIEFAFESGLVDLPLGRRLSCTSPSDSAIMSALSGRFCGSFSMHWHTSVSSQIGISITRRDGRSNVPLVCSLNISTIVSA
jgi:hypothetical protein